MNQYGTLDFSWLLSGSLLVEDLGSRRLQRERREGLNKRSRGDDNSAREPREHNKTHKKTNKKIRHNRNDKKKGKESQESKRNGRKKNIVGGGKITGADRRRTRGRNHKPGGKEMTQRRRGQGKVGQLKPSIKHLRKQNTNKLNKNIEKSKYRKKHVKNMNKLMKKKTSNTQKERRKGHKANSKIKRKRKQINGIRKQMHKNKGKAMRQRKPNKDNENRRMDESKRLKMLNKVKKNKGMEDNKRGTRPKKLKGIKGKIQMENTKGKRERSKNKQIKGNVKIKKQKRKYAKKKAKGRRKDQDMNKVNLRKKILSDGRRKASKDTLGRPTLGEGHRFRQNVKSYGLVDDKRMLHETDDVVGESAKPRKSARNRREPASLSVAEKSERLRRAAVVANVGVVPPTITSVDSLSGVRRAWECASLRVRERSVRWLEAVVAGAAGAAPDTIRPVLTPLPVPASVHIRRTVVYLSPTTIAPETIVSAVKVSIQQTQV
ncbi:serine/arginine-rich splicing factor 4-like [Procambarus clarkii]|uniref:serine/arginine-rich splicing factor 4-like n=1 Tax=Procambarus clarkii TaxID=6728 RepID=UPI003742BC8B